MRKPRVDRTQRREEISGLLRRLALSQTALRLCAEEGSAAQEEFLLRVLESEAANREEVRKARYLREAGFPVYKTLEGYEYQNLRLPPTLSRADLAAGAFIKDKKNLVLYGPVGTGKTHLATALGVLACERGIRTRFFTAAQLVVRLSEAYAGGTLEKTLASILKAELLILDEWGYVPIDKYGAQLLFRIISDSYERRSLIITTNTEFSKWGSIFTDDQMAAAMIDRLAHHGHRRFFRVFSLDKTQSSATKAGTWAIGRSWNGRSASRRRPWSDRSRPSISRLRRILGRFTETGSQANYPRHPR